jgi:hypothetical protein
MKPLSTDTIITGDSQTYELKINLQHGIEATLGQLQITVPIEMSIDEDNSATTCIAYEESTVKLLTCVINSTSMVFITHE